MHDQTSYDTDTDTAKSARTVPGGVCGCAVRHGGMSSSLVKSVGRLARGQRRKVRALDAGPRADLLARLERLAEGWRVDALGRSLGTQAQTRLDLPDIVRAMPAAGVRLGKLLALSGTDVDPANQTVAVNHLRIREAFGEIGIPDDNAGA